MVVKQIYAGWIGVVLGDKCCNGLLEFQLDNARRSQLEQISITKEEAAKFVAYAKKNDPIAFKKYIAYIELKFNLVRGGVNV